MANHSSPDGKIWEGKRDRTDEISCHPARTENKVYKFPIAANNNEHKRYSKHKFHSTCRRLEINCSASACNCWTASIQIQTTWSVLASFTHKASKWAAYCDWSRTARRRYVYGNVTIANAHSPDAKFTSFRFFIFSQMFRLTIRSSKEAVTNEIAELLIDQF